VTTLSIGETASVPNRVPNPGIRGDRNSKSVSNLLIPIILSVRVPPFPAKFSLFFSGLAFQAGWLLPNLLPNRLSTGKSSFTISVRRTRVRLYGRAAASPTVGASVLVGPARSSTVSWAPLPSVQLIASRMAVMSDSTAPSVQAAHTDSIVVAGGRALLPPTGDRAPPSDSN
jgi:hypothetical protein